MIFYVDFTQKVIPTKRINADENEINDSGAGSLKGSTTEGQEVKGWEPRQVAIDKRLLLLSREMSVDFHVSQ